MMSFLLWSLLVVIGLFILDRLLLAAERKGWIFYRHRTSGGTSGVAFGMAEFLQPGARVTIEQQESDRMTRQIAEDDAPYKKS
jgi:FtsZ-interacting cell division protein ZipA